MCCMSTSYPWRILTHFQIRLCMAAWLGKWRRLLWSVWTTNLRPSRYCRHCPIDHMSRPRGRLTSVVTLVLRRLKALFGLAQSAVCYQHVRDGARRCRGSVQPSRRGPKDRGARGAGSRSGKAKVRRERSIYNPQCQYICPPGVSPLIVSINLINHH